MENSPSTAILPPETPAQKLARSAFGFAFLALIPAVIVWFAFWFSPIPDDVAFAQVRTSIILGFGLFTLMLVGICGVLFRASPQELMSLSQRMVSVLGNRVVALLTIFWILEVNFIAFLTLTTIAPTITGPLKFLMVWWSLLLIGIIFTIHLDALSHWLKRTQNLWTGVGIALIVLIVLGGLYFLTNRVVQATGIEAQLRGTLDNRQLTFYDDGQAPAPQQFWAEQARTRVQWLPYLYWTVEPFEGEYINIAANGVRQTPAYVKDDETSQRIYFFGGSTMWGEGARDAYTIPGHVARLLSDGGQAQYIENYGQTGYVSTQEMMLFQFQLANNNVPDIAVFYDGFNDVYSAYLQDETGIPYRESNRISDAEAGRLLRAGQPVFRLPDGNITVFDWSLVGTEGASAEMIVNRWLANVRMIQALADEYGIKVLFVWQPVLIYKETLLGDEVVIRQRIDDESPGFAELYRECNAYLSRRMDEDGLRNIVILSDLFKNDARPIFHDLVHITEMGNLTVAEVLLPRIITLLNE